MFYFVKRQMWGIFVGRGKIQGGAKRYSYLSAMTGIIVAARRAG
jgi:hypothetical protein